MRELVLRTILHHTLRRRLYPLFAAACLLSQAVAAEASSRFVDLPSQPLEQSLFQISEIYGRSLVVRDGAIPAGAQGQPVRGRYSLEQALEQLLSAGELEFEVLKAGIVVAEKRPVAPPALEQVNVTGLRQSLRLSRDVKRDRLVIAEAVVADDIARYPDLNLAESLQRVPGVTITREAGEGREISLRGGFPDFTLVTLNGMPVLANSDSPMDSRGQQQRDRSFDFNIFTSEFFQRVDIDKGYSANRTAGGLTGTVALHTARPFDYPGFHWSVTPQVGFNSYSDSLSTRLSGLVSNTGERWGALVAISHSDRHAEEQGANTFRWRNIAIPPEAVTDLSAELAKSLMNGDVYLPRGNRYSLWQSEQQRATLGLAVQYRSDSHDMTLDGILGQLDLDRREDHVYSRGEQLTPLTEYTRLTDAVISEQNELIYASYDSARMASESRLQDVTTDYQQWVWQLQSYWANGLETRLLVGTEHSGFGIPSSHKIYAEAEAPLTVDYRPDRYYPHIQYGADLSSPELWRMKEIDLERYSAETRFDHAEASVAFPRGALGLRFETGIEINRFTNDANHCAQDDVLAEVWASDPQASRVRAELVSPVSDHNRLDWLGFSVPEALRYYQVSPELAGQDPEVNCTLNGIEEMSSAWFSQVSWQGTALGISTGIRYQDYRAKLDPTREFPGSSTPAEDAYWLPTFNARWWITDDWMARVGLSRNMARARIQDSTPEPQAQDNGTVSGLNRSLLPYTSVNLDLSLEHYWSERSLASLAIFHKKIEQVPAPTVLPSTELPDGVVRGVGYRNKEQMTLKGFELALQADIARLPGGDGVFGVAGHYTWLDGSMTYYNDHTAEPLFRKQPPYLSRHSGSITFYAEAERWSTRLVSTFRGRYRTRVDSATLTDEDETGFLSSWYVDATASYRLNSRVELKVEAFNLGNEREVQYSDSSLRAYNTTRSGRTLAFGLTYQYQ